MQSRNRYKKLDLDIQEKRREISQRVNDLELKLRDTIRKGIIGHYKKPDVARAVVWSYLQSDNKKYRNKFDQLTYGDLFNSSKIHIYLKALAEIIKKEWNIFEGIFSNELTVADYMTSINQYRRVHAHAGEMNEHEFIDFRKKMEWLEDCIAEWERLTS